MPEAHPAEPAPWTDAQLDVELATFRAAPGDPDLTRLRDRVVGRAHREQLRAASPRGTVVTADPPFPTPAARPARSALGAAAAVLVLVLAAGAAAVVAGGPTPSPAGGTTAPPLPLAGGAQRLPEAGPAPLLPTAELVVAASDPEPAPGQYLYRRTGRGVAAQGNRISSTVVEEVWVPADPAQEWLLRTSPVGGAPVEVRAPRGEFWGTPEPTLNGWPLPGGRPLAEQTRDPRELYELLRLGIGTTVAPHVKALESATFELTASPVPAEQRALVVSALGYVPGLRLEQRGSLAVLSAEAEMFGTPRRAELRIDTTTGQVVGSEHTDQTGTYTTTITTGVADRIGEAPAD